MCSYSIFISVTCLALSAYSEITEQDEENCKQVTTYSIKDQTNLIIEFAYDPWMEPDLTYAKQICNVFNTFEEDVVSVTFAPGFTITVTDTEIQCKNPDNNDKSCTKAIEHACASQIVPDFNCFVCCTAEGTDALSCVPEDTLEEFNQCIGLNHQSIKPLEIIKNNSETYHKKSTEGNCAPVLLINGVRPAFVFPNIIYKLDLYFKNCDILYQIMPQKIVWPRDKMDFPFQVHDVCARIDFYTDGIKVICAMLAENVAATECNQQ